MSTNETAEHRNPIPGREIVEAYRQCVRARRAYIRATSAGRTNAIESIRGEMQNAVLEFYEVLRYKLRDVDAVSKYWKKEPVFERRPVYRTDKDGNVVVNENGDLIVEEYREVGGLQQLDQYIGATETVERSTTNAFGSGESTDIRPVQMDPAMLLTCARALEAAADQMNLLALVDASTPRTKITDDMVEEVDEWEQQHRT